MPLLVCSDGGVAGDCARTGGAVSRPATNRKNGVNRRNTLGIVVAALTAEPWRGSASNLYSSVIGPSLIGYGSWAGRYHGDYCEQDIVPPTTETDILAGGRAPPPEVPIRIVIGTATASFTVSSGRISRADRWGHRPSAGEGTKRIKLWQVGISAEQRRLMPSACYGWCTWLEPMVWLRLIGQLAPLI